MNVPDLPELVRVSNDELLLETGTGALHSVAAQTLRHACVCDMCVDQTSGQRRTDVSLWPSSLTIESAVITANGQLIAVFREDGHRTVVPVTDLTAGSRAGTDPNLKVFWDATLTTGSVSVSWPCLDDHKEQSALLTYLMRYGFAIVNDCPQETGFISKLAPYIGRIKESRVGPMFDVTFEPSPSNLAFTTGDLFLHTDNPYRIPVPGWQILHCIHNAAQGGDSYVADGFACADYLKQNFLDDYTTLSTTFVRFTFKSKDASFTSRRPIIALSESGEIVQVSFNDRSMCPVYGSATDVRRFYDAYQRYRNLLADPARQIRFKLMPGQTFIVDNYRVLHARAAFSATSLRHLQGAYIDTDWVSSKYNLAQEKWIGKPNYVA